ncbi:uncharacterized protein LOC111634008 [Centruroides sculpturatus]|uniref:uncharacterized protein LOC111634008 n=1 Tax=Centruroides sculpturatus TaxID=218467 RepID=UPI000C6CCA91|nr:uncharacterized protein LOC111634008 [Centruroides sculpturatus]XP_023234447.1 uncharacterized protein LOC111634008 [Centruroides sculpturatus]XP_023234448.1 uncharacterized protein LOC111634008 [Centruroides sculpturatus]XP_023234449.1 uncharacterized protein LOC111634008 [Centruroides sculpturatus]XP_023234450.1 uncharacterized protein LOC111634008 [Centruroides sculpturatus]
MMERNEFHDSRLSHQKKAEAKKKSRSLPSQNKTKGIKMDHSAIFAAYKREEQKLGDFSLSSDTSCSSLEFLKPNEIDSKKLGNDSSSSTEKRNHSLDSLTRKERMEALKARVEAERLKYGESSSDDEKDQVKRLSRYHSDEAIHRTSRDPNRSRPGRTERYLKRRSQDESSLKNFNKGKPPAGRSGKSGQESHSPVPIKTKSIPQEIPVTHISNAIMTPLNVTTVITRNDSNPSQPSPNDSGVSTQSVASSPSIGRAPSPSKRWQETRLCAKIEPGSKMRFRNFSSSDRSRSSSDVRSEKCAFSSVSTSPVPRIYPEFIHRCRRLSTGDAENCTGNGRAMAILRPKFPDCCCHAERMCCSVPFRFVPHCANSYTNCNRKPILYSYTDQAPKYSVNSSSHVKKMVSKIQKNNEEKAKSNHTIGEYVSKPMESNASQPCETKIPSCPIHFTKSRALHTLPNRMNNVDYQSAIPRLCASGHKQKSPPSPNCRPLSMVIDTLDYLTNPKNYTNVSPETQTQNADKPIPPVPPIRKYHWNSTMNLNARSKLEDIMKKTRSSLTSPESDYKPESNENVISKSPHLSKTINKGSENLDQALKELEEIYKSLQLNDDDLADRAERRDLPTKHQEGYSSVQTRNSSSRDDARCVDENLQKRPISRSYDCLLVCNRPVQMRAPPLRRAGIADKVTDDFAYRRFQRAVSQNKQPKSENAQSYLLCSSVFTPSLSVNEYFKDLTAKSQPDVEKDDLSYRNYTQSTGAKVQNSQPPFGIPLGPVVKSSSTSYLQASPKEDTRPIYRHQETPDVVRDDMAYRNLRKDISKMFTRQNKKYRAVRSLSANISQLVNQHQALETAKDLSKAQSMNDIITALEKQSSEWKNLSRLVSPEQVKSPESSSTDDSTPRCFNNVVSGTSDGFTLSESSTECRSPKKEFREKRTQPEGSENSKNVVDREPLFKNKSVLVDCCRLVSAARDARKHKSLSVYQPSVSSPPPLRYQDVWSDTDVKMKRRTIALDENQLDALLTSLSRDTKSKPAEELPLTNNSNYVDVRITA